ncbi:GroES-like protein [Trichoderma austrokoningii]
MTKSSLIGKEYRGYRSKDGGITAFDTKIPELGPKDVVVRITHSGLCASDVAMVKLGAPVALGHEGVGIVELIGSDVKQLKVGDRVGGGYHRDACGSCKFCLKGKDIYCYDRIVLAEGDYDNGTFSQFYIGKETFLYKIPDNIPSEYAAPLQCAGVTVYTALRETVEPGMRVGIYGIGGLGHLAIQFAAKMGTEVVVYSTSADKEQEARAWGASEFHLVSTMYETIKAPIDVLVITGSYYPDFERAMTKEFLSRNGTIVPLTAPMGPLNLNTRNMFFDAYRVHASLVGSRAMHAETLEFAAKNDIKPLVQVSKLESVDSLEKVISDMGANAIRYRAVFEL